MLRELLSDPAFKRQFKTAPRVTANLAHGNPWRVWALSHEGRWSKADVPDYKRAFAIVKTKLPTYQDMSIVSLRQFFAPQAGLRWARDEAWCSRCQRPVIFGYFRSHHACSNSSMGSSLQSDARCPYCGIRREAMKEYYNDGG